MIETGIKRTEDGGIFCENCGNDLSRDGSSTFYAHADGAKFFKNFFRCNHCGAVVTQEHERSKDDAVWWGDDV